MRSGDFSELLNTSFTGAAKPIYLYQPNSGSAALLSYNGQQNVFAPNQINPIAQKILNAYPLPTETATSQNNYTTNLKNLDNTSQFDARIDLTEPVLGARVRALSASSRSPSSLETIWT